MLAFLDGRLVVSVAAVYVAGIGAAFLLGTVRDAVKEKIGLAVVLGGAYFATQYDEARLSRLSQLDAPGRIEINRIYLDVIARSPIVGLLGTRGESFFRAESEAEGHAHNAYLSQLYFGGISYGIPLFLLIVYTMWCVYRVWISRALLAIDPQPNGPLAVSGNLEIISGTGRVVARVTGARLCRCGGSASKQFCDGTHAKIGFRST